MALPFFDPFAAAAGVLANPPWTQAALSARTLNYDGAGSGKASAIDAGVDVIAYDNSNTYDNDSYAQVRIAGGLQSGNNWAELFVRCSGSGGSFAAYQFITDGVTGAGHTELWKYVAGSASLLANFATTFATDDVMAMRVVGNQITCYKNGISVGSFTDSSSPLTSGASGCGVFNTSSNTVLLDAFEGGNASSFPGVAFDAKTELIRTLTTDPQTWTHTPVGVPRAIVVAIIHGTSSTDHVVSVTYGGVALTRVVRATDSATELGAAELWFRGSGIPTGAQTVSVDLSSATGDDIEFESLSFTAAADCEVIDSDLVNDDVANPQVTLQFGGRRGLAACALYGGGAAPSSYTSLAGQTRADDNDFGNFAGAVDYQTTGGAADLTIGYTGASDDVAFVALAMAEVQAAGVRPRQAATFARRKKRRSPSGKTRLLKPASRSSSSPSAGKSRGVIKGDAKKRRARRSRGAKIYRVPLQAPAPPAARPRKPATVVTPRKRRKTRRSVRLSRATLAVTPTRSPRAITQVALKKRRLRKSATGLRAAPRVAAPPPLSRAPSDPISIVRSRKRRRPSAKFELRGAARQPPPVGKPRKPATTVAKKKRRIRQGSASLLAAVVQQLPVGDPPRPVTIVTRRKPRKRKASATQLRSDGVAPQPAKPPRARTIITQRRRRKHGGSVEQLHSKGVPPTPVRPSKPPTRVSAKKKRKRIGVVQLLVARAALPPTPVTPRKPTIITRRKRRKHGAEATVVTGARRAAPVPAVRPVRPRTIVTVDKRRVRKGVTSVHLAVIQQSTTGEPPRPVTIVTRRKPRRRAGDATQLRARRLVTPPATQKRASILVISPEKKKRRTKVQIRRARQAQAPKHKHRHTVAKPPKKREGAARARTQLRRALKAPPVLHRFRIVATSATSRYRVEDTSSSRYEIHDTSTSQYKVTEDS